MRGVLKLSAFLAAFLLPSMANAAAQCQPLRRMLILDMRPHPANVPLVPVSLEGKRTHLIVDTGAFWSFVFPGVVRELNMTPNPVPVRAYGVNGAYSDKAVRVRDFKLGNTAVGERQFMVDANRDPSDVIGENDAGGLLGAEVLSAFDVDFDFAGGKLSLFHPDHCEGQVVYWQATAVAVVPFRLENRSQIRLPVLVNGRRATALLDTGASNTVINQAIAKRLFDFDPNSPNVSQIGQLDTDRRAAAVYRTRIEKIEFQGIVVNHPMIHVIPDLMSSASQRTPIGSLIPVAGVELPDLLIGMSVLSKLHVYVAYKERKLYITAPAASVEADQAETPAAAPP